MGRLQPKPAYIGRAQGDSADGGLRREVFIPFGASKMETQIRATIVVASLESGQKSTLFPPNIWKVGGKDEGRWGPVSIGTW